MTTDTISKQVAVQFEAGGKTVTVGGMSKGSGMIHPNMCTMLALSLRISRFPKSFCRKHSERMWSTPSI